MNVAVLQDLWCGGVYGGVTRETNVEYIECPMPNAQCSFFLLSIKEMKLLVF
jgi:hypothetical protein